MNQEPTHGEKSHTSNKSPFQGFSQVQVFIFGIIEAILVLCTIGFFILLCIVLKGGVIGIPQAGSPTGVAAVQPGEPSAPQGPIVLEPVTNDDHIRGDKNAKVTLVEYSDFQCPFCGQFHPTLQQVMDTYKGKVRLVYRHYPLPFHPNAAPAAEAAECASEQGKFWEFHDAMFENQNSLGTEFYKQTAQKLGLNMSKFDDCVTTRKYKTKVEEQTAGGNAAGVGGTPHTIVVSADGQMSPVSGALPYASIAAAIDAALK